MISILTCILENDPPVNMTVTIANVPCSSITCNDDYTLLCEVGPGVGKHNPIYIYVNDVPFYVGEVNFEGKYTHKQQITTVIILPKTH